MSEPWMLRLARVSITSPRATLLVIAIFSGILGSGLLQLRTDTGYRSFLGADHPSVVRFDEFIDAYGGGLPLAAVWSCEQVLAKLPSIPVLEQVSQHLFPNLLWQEANCEPERDRHRGVGGPHEPSNRGSSPSHKANFPRLDARSAGSTASGTTRSKIDTSHKTVRFTRVVVRELVQELMHAFELVPSDRSLPYETRKGHHY